MSLLTTRDIAQRLTISEDEACRLVREGHIPHVEIPGRKHWRVRPEDLEAFVSGSVLGSIHQGESKELAANKGSRKVHRNVLNMPKDQWRQRYR